MSKHNFILEKMFFDLKDLYDSKHYIVTDIPNISKYRVVIDGFTDEAINNDDNVDISVEDNNLRIYISD